MADTQGAKLMEEGILRAIFPSPLLIVAAHCVIGCASSCDQVSVSDPAQGEAIFVETTTSAKRFQLADASDELGLRVLQLRSTADGSMQPSRVWLPPGPRDSPAPLLVFLHSWSANFKQNKPEWLREAQYRNWIFLQPNFRGPNNRPEACGSLLAQQDILDVIDWAVSEFNGDPERIYLAGASGGGHMALLMAGRHPERFSAVSAWVGISDLADWHRFHSKNGQPQKYARMLEAVCGGAPGDSPAVDFEYHNRSPLTWLQYAGDLPIDLAAGIHDGKTGSVPFQHTLRAFNVIARQVRGRGVTESEMDELWDSGTLRNRRDQPPIDDPTFGREIKFRRIAGSSRVSLFEGGHEGLPTAACAWLSTQSRTTRVSSTR